jgi:hypothetical protein
MAESGVTSVSFTTSAPSAQARPARKGGPMNLLSALRLERRPTPAEPLQIRLVENPKPVLSTAEVAECTCPEFCERDHGNE